MSFDNIGSQKVPVDADYSISNQIKISGFIAAKFSEESYKQAAYEGEELTVRVRAGLDM